MEHVVFFTGTDGAAQFRRTPSLQEAVRVVEHLRNVESIDDARVFSLTEVPLQFKAVYRVELPTAQPGAPEPLAPLPPMPAMPDLSAALPTVEPDPAPVAPAAEAPEPVAEAAEAPVADVPAPVAEVAEAPEAPAVEPVAEPEPVLAAVPSEPYEAPAESPSNGKPAARGMGFFSR